MNNIEHLTRKMPDNCQDGKAYPFTIGLIFERNGFLPLYIVFLRQKKHGCESEYVSAKLMKNSAECRFSRFYGRSCLKTRCTVFGASEAGFLRNRYFVLFQVPLSLKIEQNQPVISNTGHT